MKTSQVLTIALLVIGPAALLWGLFLLRQSRGPGRTRLRIAIPQALRPGAPDEVLEGPRLERIQVGWLLATLSMAIFIPAYWLPEAQRQEAFQERFDEDAIHRGQLIFTKAPELQDDIEAVEFKEIEKGVALGQGCANCHGPADAPDEEDIASGGFANPAHTDPLTGEVVQYQAPPLNNVFTRWDDEVVRFTIERGRPGTPMPAWGVEFGGSMTELMVSDVMAFLHSLPGNNRPPAELSAGCDPDEPEDPEEREDLPSLPDECGQEIFEARCAVCHGPEGQGKEDTTLREYFDEQGNPVERKLWYQGLALWNGDVKHLDKGQHLYTVRNGRRFAFMPTFAQAPVQYVPVPPYPLTDRQIEAVMAYERTL